MIQGLNCEIAVGGERYHVQTENVGDNLVTLIFKGGAVVARAKQTVGAIEGPSRLDKLRRLMRSQHELMINKLHEGELVPITAAEQRQVDKEEKDLIAKFLSEWAEED
ncbi:MAG: hypothetical protein JSU81_00100 [Candidatus Coatesbacteria bacterium]|nr:MAG: hypothetical protein JSU81_00100 [Candidatus Coatesbacteria bacterium]